MSESLNIFDLLGKIDWEGGISSVLDYGLRDIEADDVPDELKEAWADMADCFADFESLADDVMYLIHRAETTYSEEKDF